MFPLDMFLYAHLTIEHLLQQQTKGDLLEKIKTEMLPDKLSELYGNRFPLPVERYNIDHSFSRYENLIGSIKSRLRGLPEGNAQWEKAKVLLSWVVCAKRPLEWREIQSILSFDAVNNRVDFDNRMVRHDVRRYLGSLVHLLDGGRIRLVHSTARR